MSDKNLVITGAQHCYVYDKLIFQFWYWSGFCALCLQVEVKEGYLVCPETGRQFPITNGIPNMLLNEDEVWYDCGHDSFIQISSQATVVAWLTV